MTKIPNGIIDAQETASCLKRFKLPFQTLDRIFRNNSKEFVKICQRQQWTPETTRILFVVQKPRKSRKELFDEQQKEHRQRLLEVANPMSGGTLQWYAMATGTTCTTRWPTAKQSVRNLLCDIQWTFHPIRNQSQLQISYKSLSRVKAAPIWKNKMLHVKIVR